MWMGGRESDGRFGKAACGEQRRAGRQDSAGKCANGEKGGQPTLRPPLVGIPPLGFRNGAPQKAVQYILILVLAVRAELATRDPMAGSDPGDG